jgi:tetratricopeptide (TPR) repeat protein
MRKILWLLVGLAALAGVGLVVRSRAVPDDAAAVRVHVDDAAELLFPLGTTIEGQCKGTRGDLGIDVRVVTRRAAGEDVAPLAERLFRELGVGEGAPTGGILIVLERDGGQARIEVSYSLEGVLPDVFLSRLARDQLVPYASHRAAGMAVMDVVHFLRNRLLDAAAAGELSLGPALRTDALSQLLAARSGGAGAQVELPEVPSHAERKRRVPDELRARYAPSADPLESAEAFQRVRRDLVGDPTLELFTEGTRVMRARYPVAPYEELLRVDAFERAHPLRVQVRGDRAFVDTEKPARDFIPILLVREQGLWRIDLVETFKNFFFDEQGMFRLVNLANPYAVFLPGVWARTDDTLTPLPLPEPLEDAIARLETSAAAGDRYRLAELLMRNCFLFAEAIPLYAEAARLAPGDAKIALTFADRATYLYMPEIAIDAVAALGPRYWSRLAWLHERAGQTELAKSYYRKALDRDPRNTYARTALERLAEATR